MKVLHIIPSVSDLRGGTSQAVIDIVRALNQQQIDATIVATNDNGETNLAVPLNEWVSHAGVNICFFQRFSPPIHPLREFSYSASLTQWLWQHCKEYDLLHIHALFSYPSTSAMMIARLKGVPYILMPHGLLCQWSLRQSFLKKKFFFNLFEHANIQGSRALHFTTRQEQEEVKSVVQNSDSYITPLGLNILPSIPDAHQKLCQIYQISDSVPIILFLSRFHRKKGLEALIDSLGHLKGTPFNLLLAGSGPADYVKSLKDRVQNVGISNKTQFVGFVSGYQKQLLLQGSDIFTLTSFSENFGIAVLEAMASGLPVIVTPGVALSDIVTKNQLGFVPDLSTQEITAAISRFLQNPDEAKQMGKRARKFIQENYTWDKIATDLIEVYQAILANQPLPSRLQPTATV